MIPVFEPSITDADVQAVTAALKRGEVSGTHGEEIRRFEQSFANYVGAGFGVATSSGTTALHLAVAAAGIGPGDEVLVSAATNIATALAVVHNGATVVPVDSETRTRNLDLDLLDSLLTPRTRAIIPVHLFGQPVDMERLMSWADRHNVLVIEDCAEAHGATVRGRMVGSFGHLACFSFYANKIITTGEGGMVLTSDQDLVERLRLLRNLAFTQPRFRHEALGFNFRMTGLQAALGRSQLDRIAAVLARKRALADAYALALCNCRAVTLPPENDWSINVHWMYAIEVAEGAAVTRDALAAHLKVRGIDTRTFFCPMNIQPALQTSGALVETACPIAERMWRGGLYLPSSPDLSSAQVEYIANAIREVLH